jgi:phosphoglucosamine mutase
MNDPEVQSFAKELNSKLDGTGRLLLRKSGTEPVIRIMVEAQTLEECDLHIAKAEEFISGKL